MSSSKQRAQIPIFTRLAGTAFGVFLLFWWGLLCLLSRLMLSYALTLLYFVWFDWHQKGKDVLVVFSGKSKKPLEVEALLEAPGGISRLG